MASLFIWPYILVTIATCCDASPVLSVSDKAHLKHTHVLVVFASILGEALLILIDRLSYFRISVSRRTQSEGEDPQGGVKSLDMT